MNTRGLMIGTVLLAGFTAVMTAQNAGPDWPQWRGPRRDGTLTAFTEPKTPAPTPQSALEDHGRRGLFHSDHLANRVYQFRDSRKRNPARHRCATGSDLGTELRSAVRDELWCQTAWPRTEIDADIR